MKKTESPPQPAHSTWQQGWKRTRGPGDKRRLAPPLHCADHALHVTAVIGIKPWTLPPTDLLPTSLGNIHNVMKRLEAQSWRQPGRAQPAEANSQGHAQGSTGPCLQPVLSTVPSNSDRASPAMKDGQIQGDTMLRAVHLPRDRASIPPLENSVLGTAAWRSRNSPRWSSTGRLDGRPGRVLLRSIGGAGCTSGASGAAAPGGHQMRTAECTRTS